MDRLAEVIEYGRRRNSFSRRTKTDTDRELGHEGTRVMGKGVVSVKTHIPLVENPIPDSPYVIPDPKSAKGPAFPTSNSIDMFDAMSSRPSELTAALARRYSIDREIGQGGMATVYLAEDMKHHRQVAVKVLRPELAAILGGERFLKEIEVTAGLQHPNILPLYDSGEAASFLYYVMPYLEGESLRDKLNRETQLGLEETVQLAREISGALQFAHDRGVVHRDIKPENILLQAGQALVADFGIALAVSQAGGTRLTETGLSLGTPHYVSPEQATGDRDVDSRSDVYSLGAMVYEMLTGEPPHTGNTRQAIVAKVLTDTPIPISRTRNLVPANVEAAVQRALAKSPADRFTDADGFAAALI
ncbi:MAG: serine/threonine-protein kinase, partial [Gemmatimonadales bacterium]